MSATTFRFLDLPVCIRASVFETLFAQATLYTDFHIDLPPFLVGSHRDVLLVCKVIRAEAMPILHQKILASVYHLSVKTEAYDGVREDFDKALRDPNALRDMMSFSKLTGFEGRVRGPEPDQADLREVRLIYTLDDWGMDSAVFANMFVPGSDISQHLLESIMPTFGADAMAIAWLDDFFDQNEGKKTYKIILVVSIGVRVLHGDERGKAVSLSLFYSRVCNTDGGCRR